MATRRNRVAPQQVGLRAPQAATFRAQAVPHIGAQRRSGVGDNARRLAESLGAFNNALRGFGASMDQMMAARSKRNEAMAVSFEELGVANEAERQQKIREVGGDPRVDAIFDINYVKNQYIPQRQAEFKAELDGFAANEWSVEEEGPDGEPTRRRMTQADIDQMRYEKNREIEAQYEDKPEYHSIRDALQETVNAEYRATTEAFGAFLNEEANAKANTIVYDNAPATTKALFKATNGDADKMAQALVGESQRLINGELNLKLPRDEIVTSNLKSLQNALTANPEDVELAEAALKLVEGKPHKDTANFLGQKKFVTDAQRIQGLAMDTIGKRDHDLKVKSTVEGIFTHLANGGTLQTMGLEELETQGGTKTFKMSVDDLLNEYAVERDSRILQYKGKMPYEAIADFLASDTARSDVPSPHLKEMIKGFKTNPDFVQQNPDAIQKSYVSFSAVARHDPKNLKNYIKNAELQDDLDKTRLLVEQQGLSPQDAARVVYQFKQDDNNLKFFRSTHKKIIDQFMSSGNYSNLKAVEKDKIVQSAGLLLSNKQGEATDAQVKAAIDVIAEDRLKRVATVYGRAIQVHPMESGAEAAEQKLKWAIEGAAAEAGVDPEQISTVLSSNTYYFINNVTGAPLLGKDGQQIVSGWDVMTEGFKEKTQKEATEHKKRQSDWKESMGSGNSAFRRQLSEQTQDEAPLFPFEGVVTQKSSEIADPEGQKRKDVKPRKWLRGKDTDIDPEKRLNARRGKQRR